jgi:hypothetical protein
MSSNNSEASKPVRRKFKFKKFIFIFVVLLLVGLTAFYFISGLPYSDGSRSGILIKVSRKGYIFKTYEGELNVGGFSQGDGTIMPAKIFYFSVPRKDVYVQLDSLQGRKVVLYYKQVYHNFFWQGDTDYFIERVTLAK